MNYKYQVDLNLTKLLKLKIKYNETYETYMLNDTWVNEIDEYFYEDKIGSIKNLIAKQLKYGLKQKEFLEDLSRRIYNKYDRLKNYDLNSLNFFETYPNITFTKDDSEEKPASNASLFENYSNENELAYEKNPVLIGYLNHFSNKLNGLKTKEDFEKGLLLYALNNYKSALWDLHGYISEILNNVDFIDFKNINIEDQVRSAVKKNKNRLGHFNLSKKDVAHFFRILLEEDYLVFDETSDNKNELEMKKFVEANFTFRNHKKERIRIKTFNREYSEVIYKSRPGPKLHRDFIDKLILKLQMRKKNIKD
ncbi:hypothetical protein [Psychroflexus planctonicus]|uniref:Uncharacterized protein n=1 Tax=Psychroflexus planctonicus TaxID=1526575 RepID=A0ABQ1SP54_9FLAO|nr:hypothetical protein [Psychroflexus planctonicus]GGE44396.1 hypothetical protein GCM10010832_25530 [Psychroflexus planctonicus]